MSWNTSDVEAIFSQQIGSEIESTLRTVKDLPDDRRAELNSPVSRLIQEKKSALAAIKDKRGNEAAYFLIGMLFVWDTARIRMCGTGQELMTSATVRFQTPQGETLMGYGNIAKYFFDQYIASGGNNPGYLHIIRTIFASIQTP